MEIRKPEPSLVRAGFVLFTLALLTGFAVPAFLNQRMALAAHLTGVLNALVLMALGLTWGLLAFGPLQAKLTRGAFLYATYANWGTPSRTLHPCSAALGDAQDLACDSWHPVSSRGSPLGQETSR